MRLKKCIPAALIIQLNTINVHLALCSKGAKNTPRGGDYSAAHVYFPVFGSPIYTPPFSRLSVYTPHFKLKHLYPPQTNFRKLYIYAFCDIFNASK